MESESSKVRTIRNRGLNNEQVIIGANNPKHYFCYFFPTHQCVLRSLSLVNEIRIEDLHTNERHNKINFMEAKSNTHVKLVSLDNLWRRVVSVVVSLVVLIPLKPLRQKMDK